MGDFVTARQAAARIYRGGVPAPRRYQAARLAALAAANEERYTLSELWLRRALIVAPTPEDVAETTQDAARVSRARNPWSTSVRLSFSPSTNINGGAMSELNYIDGVPIVGVLSASAQALTGFVALADLRTTYRLNESRTSRQTVGARIYARAPIPVGGSLQAIWDEGVEIEDLSTARIEFSFEHDQAVEDGAFGINADIGGYWSGAEFDYSYLRIGGDRTFRLSPELTVNGRGYVEQRFATEDFAREDLVLSLTGTVATRLPDGGQGSASLSWLGRQSDNINDTYDSLHAAVGLQPAERLGPMELSGAIGLQYTDYPGLRRRLHTRSRRPSGHAALRRCHRRLSRLQLCRLLAAGARECRHNRQQCQPLRDRRIRRRTRPAVDVLTPRARRLDAATIAAKALPDTPKEQDRQKCPFDTYTPWSA